ncbi:DUF3768 domain-containing protein [Bradyrhizobium sp. AC87j1]|uniref:DUF3768 domain-containing protein n=1 Tax=Bradyrhizobium sp. AC87j1 TaxID=2055894 RepID=UPI001374BE5C|nr:DUF3768 domain-containing protein [Bradyrhizobium sp. AC87j1]
MDKTARVRELNDAFRQTFTSGLIQLSARVNALPDADKAMVLDKVRTQDLFDRDYDPYGEHTFLLVEHDGAVYFARIQYYGADLRRWSDDPSDPIKTVRVLTVMHEEEY